MLRTATGDGERIMQFCPSYQIVQHMRTGDSPQAACDRVVTDMLTQTNKWFEVGLIALDNKVPFCEQRTKRVEK